MASARHRMETATARTLVVLLGLALAGGPIAASESPDEGFLEQYAATYRFRLGQPSSIRATPDGDTLLFLRSESRDFSRALHAVDLPGGNERVVLTAGDLLQGETVTLSAEEKARRERMRLAAGGIAGYVLSADGRRILVPLGSRLFLHDLEDSATRELVSSAGYPIDPQFSPDGRRVACVRDGDLYVFDLDRGGERRLTEGGGGEVSHGLAEFVAQEEMGRYHGFWWSPDSKRIVYQETRSAHVETMHLGDSIRPQQEPNRWRYPRPGRRNVEVRLGLIDAGGGPTRWIDWDRDSFEYVAKVQWPAGSPLTLLVQNRRQTEQRLLAVNPEDGTTRTVLTERDPAWVDIADTVPRFDPEGRRFLWIGQRQGTPTLELHRLDDPKSRPLTPVGLTVQQLEHVDWERQQALVRAGDDPTQRHIYRIDLTGRRPPRRLTREPGVHDGVSRGGPGLVVTSASDRDWPRWRVFGYDGPTEVELTSLAETPPFVPETEFVTVGDARRLHAVLVRPRDFDPERRYPVIVHVYGGPTSQMVQRDARRYLLDQWFADRGYVVVAIDGRGTPNRGRDWQRSVRHDLIGLPLQDQRDGLLALGRRFAELDLSRVGIYGWSFGGYVSAMAVMREPSVFHVGVAGAPVVDWLDYDTHYTERYMDLPQNNVAGYAASNVLTYAERLERPLLLIHGTDDDNVYFLHSLRLADALFRAGKEFEFLPLPGFTHMVPDPLVTRRLYDRIGGLFDRHLQPGATKVGRAEAGAPP